VGGRKRKPQPPPRHIAILTIALGRRRYVVSCMTISPMYGTMYVIMNMAWPVLTIPHHTDPYLPPRYSADRGVTGHTESLSLVFEVRPSVLALNDLDRLVLGYLCFTQQVRRSPG